MLIPIDRPLIDARNIRNAATQTITGNDVIVHNNRPAVHLTINNAGDNTCTIADGTAVGQTLVLLVVVKTAGQIIIADSGNAALKGQWYRPEVYFGLLLSWNGTAWNEMDRFDTSGVNSGLQANSVGGRSNTNSGNRSGSVGGYINNNTNSYTGSLGGYNNTNSGNESGSVGGDNNINSGFATGSVGGLNGVAGLYAEQAHAAGMFAAAGDAQFSQVVFRGSTTDATLTEIFLDGDDDRLALLDEYTYACKVMVVGRQDNGVDHFMGTYHVLIRRVGGGTAIPTGVDIIYESNAGGWGAGGGLPVVITGANTSLTIKVEGLAGHNIRWVAVVDMIRVHYED